MQSLSNYQWQFFSTELEKKKLYGETIDLSIQSNLEKEKQKWQNQNGSLTSDYTTKIQLSKQYSTGAEIEIYETCSREQGREPRNKAIHLWPINL